MFFKALNLSVKRRVYSIAGIAGIGLFAVLLLSLAELRANMWQGITSSTRHVVEAAESVLAFYQRQEVDGRLTREQAQQQAKAALRAMRYDGDQYIFVIDMTLTMIVNPFSPKLEGTDVSAFKDMNGIAPFRTMADEVRKNGQGVVTYSWPKPGKAGQQPKLSYVKGFAPWGWIVCSGIYVDDVEEAILTMTFKIGGLAVLAGMLVVGFCIIVARGIIGPVNRITARAAQLANGDVETSVPFVTLNDEVGAIARSIEVFRRAAVVKARLEGEAAVIHHLAEDKLRRTEFAYGEAGAKQTAVVTAMAYGLTRLADGDLAYRVTVDFPEDYAQLKTDFNEALTKLMQTLRTISSSTQTIGVGSSQITQASDDLSRRTEQQAASLEETAAALNLITETVKKMAGGAEEAAKVAVDTRNAARNSDAVVQQAVEAMSKIKDSSFKITQIIGVIDEIAFQTNLLALNAGVEAARAGDAGRGFAVVASEVRGLAQRSAEAAKEIKALISASTSQVESGVALVDKTGDALKEIIVKIGAVDSLIHDISAQSKAQATGLAEVNVAVMQMDQVVQRNAAMVEETTAAAHALRHETGLLANAVSSFQIDEPRAKSAAFGSRI